MHCTAEKPEGSNVLRWYNIHTNNDFNIQSVNAEICLNWLTKMYLHLIFYLLLFSQAL
jgi:hypothetical protein